MRWCCNSQHFHGIRGEAIPQNSIAVLLLMFCNLLSKGRRVNRVCTGWVESLMKQVALFLHLEV